MVVGIVGCGALGLFYGARLSRAGFRVKFLLRSDFEIIQQRGIEIQSPEGTFMLRQVESFRSPEKMGGCDLVIVALKTTANDTLPKLIPPLLHGQSLVLTLQNGLGNEQALEQLAPAESIIGGVCFVCLNRIAPGVVKHLGHGALEIGAWRGAPRSALQQVANLFKQANLSCTISDHLEATRWRKLVWNIPFNGLSITRGGVDVSTLLANEEDIERIRRLMREVIAVASALGHELGGESLIEDQIEKTRVMKAYQPSSLIDWKLKRPVELEALWERPLAIAERLGVPIPELRQLVWNLRHCLSDQPTDSSR